MSPHSGVEKGTTAYARGAPLSYGKSTQSGTHEPMICPLQKAVRFRPFRPFARRYKVASPIEYVNKDFRLILFAHGTYDQVVPFVQFIKIAGKVNAVSRK